MIYFLAAIPSAAAGFALIYWLSFRAFKMSWFIVGALLGIVTSAYLKSIAGEVGIGADGMPPYFSTALVWFIQGASISAAMAIGRFMHRRAQAQQTVQADGPASGGPAA